MPRVRYHPDVVRIDLPKLFARLGSNDRVEEFLRQFNKAIDEVLAGKGIPESEMRIPYRGWYRKKFHSRLAPKHGERADMRLIYRLEGDDTLHVLAVGMRLPGSPDDVYAIGENRVATKQSD